MGAVADRILAYDIPRLHDGAPIDEVIPAWFIVAGTWGWVGGCSIGAASSTR